MEYILIIIGLILIYLGLRFDIKKQEKGEFKNALSKSLENNEFDEFKKGIGYMSSRLDNVENEITLLNSNINFLENEFKKATEDIEFYKNRENKTIVKDETNNIPIEMEKINLKIYKLYDSGKSIEEISSILRIGKGEVSLRLGLRK